MDVFGATFAVIWAKKHESVYAILLNSIISSSCIYILHSQIVCMFDIPKPERGLPGFTTAQTKCRLQDLTITVVFLDALEMAVIILGYTFTEYPKILQHVHFGYML